MGSANAHQLTRLLEGEFHGHRIRWHRSGKERLRRSRRGCIELLGHSDVSTTMIYPLVLKVAAGGTASPLDALAPALP
jgi:hypothetical protein